MSLSSRLAVVLLLIALPGAAMAQATVGNIGPGNASAFGNINDVQSLLAPADAATLTEVSLGMAHPTSAQNYTVSIHRDNAGSPGPAVATSGTFTTTTAVINYGVQVYTLSTPLTVTPNERLYIQVNAPANTAWWAVTNDYYPDGGLIENGTSRPEYDAYFLAQFTTIPTPVPTLTEWAMILFGLGLAGGAVLMIQRRRLTV
ncbi:IPTL-CTERM sorting domain-containing protein [Brevundimonas sp.]|uniref:IPTL-CTERM sorting domain-containing protein n=1 Tax=Brevundimonas sp. TaxID=1871086 RepID=UPI00262BEFDA|nr:IPTL-CTERM sorting domain-containing protein [Brevundimonas sp.]